LIPNPMVANQYVMGPNGPTGTTFSNFDYNGTLVPRFFSQTIQTSQGSRPLSGLLDNMLVVRGYGTNLDGHPTNCIRQLMPVGGVSSLTGLAAENSPRYFPATQWPERSTTSAFFSHKGQSLNTLGDQGVRPVHKLLEGLAKPPESRAKAKVLAERNKAAMDRAMEQLMLESRIKSTKGAIISDNLKKAKELMAQGLGDIDAYWTEATTRYRNLMQASMRDLDQAGFAGLSLPVVAGDPRWRMQLSGMGDVYASGDFKTYLTTLGPYESLVGGFALAEFVISKQIGTAVEIYSPALVCRGELNGKEVFHDTDMHTTGQFTALPIMSAFWRGMGAAITELKQRLQAIQVNGVDLWSDTLVQTISDFERSARTDAGGSDHGFNQMVTSVFSGGFTNGPAVIGNVSRNGVNESYIGSQGVGVEIEGYNQKGMPSPIMAASCVAALMRVPTNLMQIWQLRW
jgi:hypothetical protein